MSDVREPSLSTVRGRHHLLIPLFLVSLVGIGFEIALTRYFAIANWSEYGYLVISIAMVGFSASGVLLSLFRDYFEKKSFVFLGVLPMVLMICAALGFYAVTCNSFNPLELQNPLLMLKQGLNIGKYYAALFPFFFLTGGYVGLNFLAFQNDIPKVYGVDLAGAGLGAVLVLLLLFWIHPFYLLPALLPLLAFSSLTLISAQRMSRAVFIPLTLIILAGCEVMTIQLNRADYNEYKSIYPALHVAGNKVIATFKSPRGYFSVLDNFTERLDIDVSNNTGLLQLATPPQTYGLYKDGHRISSLPKEAKYDFSYTQAALDTGCYRLFKSPKTLLIGTRGGFRVQEVLTGHTADIVALEPDKTLYALITDGPIGHHIPFSETSSLRILNQSPAEFASWNYEPFDIIDISSDFMDQSYANRFAFTLEAFQDDFKMLKDDGVISVPVSIREFTVYAVKMILTAQRALEAQGIIHPENHIMVYRSAWNVRILIFKNPVRPEQINRLKTFCDERSFDLSYYPGIKPKEAPIWNDLPMVSFNSDQILSASNEPTDALMDLTVELFDATQSSFLADMFFNLDPMSYNRPFFYSILKFTKLHKILAKIALIPREEIGYLINIAVLVQSFLFACVVLVLPLVRWRDRLPDRKTIDSTVLYFAGLGLGFLFLEIYLIDKVSFYLNDNTSAFAAVLAGMLVFSGLGSYLSGRYLANPRKAVQGAIVATLVWILLAILFLDHLLMVTLALPFVLKCVLVMILVAPLSVALGFPFPLGLYLFRGEKSNFLPWAWSLNGAFSVIATPLANLVAVSYGYTTVLLASAALYLFVGAFYPAPKGQNKLK